MLKIIAQDARIPIDGQNLRSTANNNYAKFRTFLVVDESGVTVYEAKPARLGFPRELSEARADCQDFIDSQTSR